MKTDLRSEGSIFRSRWTVAWAALTAAFALHVWDEATHDFLSWYNPNAAAIRARFGEGWFPPSFDYSTWLGGLCVAVLLLAAITPAVRDDRRWLIPLAYLYGLIHLVNGVGHLTVSVLGRWIAPGALSAPVLLLAAVWLLYETSRIAASPKLNATG